MACTQSSASCQTIISDIERRIYPLRHTRAEYCSGDAGCAQKENPAAEPNDVVAKRSHFGRWPDRDRLRYD